ncbi:sensor histidine kinase [Pseudomonas sp. NPDC089554]|uniref:sensor histidine kinase n=1 Tax=Pseudomonas sp. NPDC089554 TaxID=3390653 RepID=UPI003D04267E
MVPANASSISGGLAMRFVKKIQTNSLRLKILLAYLAGMLLSVTLLVLAATWVLQDGLLQRWDFNDLPDAMAREMRFDDTGRPVGFQLDDMEFVGWAFDLENEGAYRVLDDTGAVVLRSDTDARIWPVDGELQRLERARFEFEHQGGRFYGATEPIVHGDRTWYLQVMVSTRFMALLHRVALPLVSDGILLFSLVSLLTFAVFAYIILRFTLQPLQEVSASAMAISPRSLRSRLSTEAVPSEIAPLVRSFNQALDRLEHGYRVQQEFLGNAAHELKTPLALIRAQIELRDSPGGQRDALLSDVEYMSRQVQQLLLLAEASEVNNYLFSRVRPQDVAEEVVAYLRRASEAANVHLVVCATEDVAWNADRGALFTLLKNLLENAIQHAPPRSVVSVEIQAASLSVRDQGPGVEVEQLPLLFERFWRAPHRRDLGAGLGLAICKEIALAHGWRIEAERAEPGLRFWLSHAS